MKVVSTIVLEGKCGSMQAMKVDEIVHIKHSLGDPNDMSYSQTLHLVQGVLSFSNIIPLKKLIRDF